MPAETQQNIRALRHDEHSVVSVHPELRSSARLARLLMPKIGRGGFRLVKRLADNYLLGTWKGKKTVLEERSMARPDGSLMRLCLIRAAGGAKRNATGLLWLHGGGYAFGRPEQSAYFADCLAGDGSTVMVAPDYTLSVEKPYPAGLDDAYAALAWMIRHADSLGIRPDQLFVGGESGGGGLTAALCHLARDRGEIAIAFQMPLYPMLDDRHASEAPDNKAPYWSRKNIQPAWRIYLDGKDGSDDITAYAAPARAIDVSGLPPAGSYNGSLDMFYNETIDYLARLQDAGIPVHFKSFDGGYHGFELIHPHTSIGRAAASYLTSMYQYAQAHYFRPQP